jgi:hypothetical protein
MEKEIMENVEKIQDMEIALHRLNFVLENSGDEKKGVVGSFYNALCVSIGALKQAIKKLEKRDV